MSDLLRFEIWQDFLLENVRDVCLRMHGCVKIGVGLNNLLHEYRDLFIDMDVRNNRSELALANRHQERWNFTR